MFRPSFSCRTLVAFALAVALAAPATLSAANAGTDHQQCEREGHSCGNTVRAACCCHVGQANPSTPAPAPAGRATLVGLDAVPSTVPALLMGSVDAHRISSATLRMHAPPHGCYFGDLNILLSIFLI